MQYLRVLDSSGNRIPVARMTGAYEGAATGRRMSIWGLSNPGPNTAIMGSLTSLRSRTLEIIRNNPLASGACDTWTANLIGRGITPRWQVKDPGLKKEIQELWADFTQETDAAGMSDFYGMQSLIARAMFYGGEALARIRPRGIEDGLAVPFQVQLLEGDHLDPAYSVTANNGNPIRMGIEFNGLGKRAAYHLFREHPGEAFYNTDSSTRVRIPASEILHIYRLLRIGQIRGVPCLTPTLIQLHEIDQCEDAELVRRKTTAMFGGFIHGPQEQDIPGAHLGRRVEDDVNENQVIAIEPGTFPMLPPGMQVTFAEPKDVSGNYVAWMKYVLHSVARGIGITYEQLTGDLEGVTYSSIRTGLLEFRRFCRSIQAQTIVFQFCRPIGIKFMDLAVMSGALKIRDYMENRRKYLRIQWRPDGWDWVDPQKDQKAEMTAVRNGFKSRAQVVAERGHDVEVVDNEIAEDNQRADELGLVLDSDPRHTTSTGIYQDTDGDGEEKD